MKKTLKYVVTVVLPLAGLTALVGACASSTCNNDACYDRRISSVDPYKEGDIAAWGTEKEQAERDDELARKQPFGGRLDGARAR